MYAAASVLAAASEGHDAILNKLLFTGRAGVNAKDKEGTNSLMATAASAKGIGINSQNVDGYTALMFVYNGKNQVETLWERYSQFVSHAKLETPAGACWHVFMSPPGSS